MDKTLLIIIIVSVITSFSLIGIFKNMKEGFGPFNLKVYGLTLVAGLSVILALSELPADKTTPCFSILAAIAGYLFGVPNNAKTTQDKKQSS